MNKQSKMSVSKYLLAVALLLCVAVLFAACTPDQPTPQPSVTLKSVAVTTQPTKTSYVEGDKFDKTGMVVTATYSDDTTKTVTNYTVSPDGALATTDKKVTVAYTEGKTTVNAEVAITVTAKEKPQPEVTLSAIEVTTAPTKVSYLVGDKFDQSGMVVTAKYSDGTTKAVTNYTIDLADKPLVRTNQKVVVSYTEGSVTKTANVKISVAYPLDSLSVNTLPTKTEYFVGESFDPTGMEIVAWYKESEEKKSKKVITDYTYAPTGELSEDVTAIVVSYTENGITKTVDVPVTVVDPDAKKISADGSWTFEESDAEINGCARNAESGASGGYALGNFQAGGTVSYTIESKGAYDADLYIRVSCGMDNRPADLVAGQLYTITVNGTALPSSQTAMNGELGWANYIEYRIGRLALAEGSNTIVITYSGICPHNFDNIRIVTGENMVTKPVNSTLTAIEVTTAPTKITYEEGEKFDATGMVVTAHYEDATLDRTVGEYVIDKTDALATTDTVVTISWTEKGVTKTATVQITVTEKVITTDLTKDGVFVIEEDHATAEGANVNAEGGTTNGKAFGGFQNGAKLTFTVTSSEATSGQLYFRLATGMDAIDRSEMKLNDNYTVVVNGKTVKCSTLLNGPLGWTNYSYYLAGDIDVLEGSNTIEISYLAACPFNFDCIKFQLGTEANQVDVKGEGKVILEEDRAVIAGGNVNNEGGTTNGKAIGGMAPGGSATFTWKFTSNGAYSAKLYLRLATGMGDIDRSAMTLSSNYKVTINGVECVSNTLLNGENGWTNYVEYLVGEVNIVEGENTVVVEYLGLCNFNVDNIQIVVGE